MPVVFALFLDMKQIKNQMEIDCHGEFCIKILRMEGGFSS
jgi:hypothetical protein